MDTDTETIEEIDEALAHAIASRKTTIDSKKHLVDKFIDDIKVENIEDDENEPSDAQTDGDSDVDEKEKRNTFKTRINGVSTRCVAVYIDNSEDNPF